MTDISRSLSIRHLGPKRLLAVIWSLVAFVVSVVVPKVWAIPAEYQMCEIGETCVLGEFYYDDDYTPLTSGVSCVLNGRDSADVAYFSSVAMSGNSDGWYSHSFDSTGALEGIYPTTMCCTYSGETQCIDKTFQMLVIIPGQAIDAGDIATAVWTASASSYTNQYTIGGILQNLPSTIWNYSSRTLTDISSLVTQIWDADEKVVTVENTSGIADAVWDNDTRTLTDSDGNEITNISTSNTTSTTTTTSTGGTINSSTVNQIATQVEQISNLLNQLVEGSSTTTITSGNDDQSLQAKIEQTRDYLTQLFANTQSVTSQLELLQLSWSTMTASELEAEFELLANTIGSSSSSTSYDQSMAGMAGWLAQQWQGDLSLTYQTDVAEAARLVGNILTSLERGQKTTTAEDDLTSLIAALDSSSITLGNVSSVESEKTLYGYLKLIQRVAETLALADNDVNQLLNDWEAYSAGERESTLDAIAESVMEVNFLPKASDLLTVDGSTGAGSQNQAVRLKALIRANQLILTNSSGDPITMVWMEEGETSVIFRSMEHNPSATLPQTATLSYNLPRELTESSIKSKDESLGVNYDTEKDLLTVTGSYALDPLDTQFQQLVTEDFWVMSEGELLAMKQQAAELLDALVDTSYYGQGATLKSDIDVAIDKLLASNGTSLTPENRIVTFRQGETELAGVRDKLEKLKDLVTEATAKNSIFGFVGGVQAIAVWGIIVIVIAGFIFLTMYMRLLHRQEMVGRSSAVPSGIQTMPSVSRSVGTLTPALGLTHHDDRGNGGGRLVRRNPLDRAEARTSRKKPASAETKLFTIVFLALTASALSAMVSGSVMEGVQKATKTGVAKQVAKSVSGEPVSPVVISADQQPQIAHSPQWYKADESAVLGSSDSMADESSEVLTSAAMIRVPGDNQVKVRNEPSTDAGIMIRISKDKEVAILEKVGEWYSVRLELDGEELTGWVYGEYVDVE